MRLDHLLSKEFLVTEIYWCSWHMDDAKIYRNVGMLSGSLATQAGGGVVVFENWRVGASMCVLVCWFVWCCRGVWWMPG